MKKKVKDHLEEIGAQQNFSKTSAEIQRLKDH